MLSLVSNLQRTHPFSISPVKIGQNKGNWPRSFWHLQQVQSSNAKIPERFHSSVQPSVFSSKLHSQDDLTREQVPRPVQMPNAPEFAQMKEWIIFSDLHVRFGTLDTCLQVLDKIREIANSRAKGNCGVIFLGDFWHVRGALPVNLLNPVMSSLSKWEMPVIMIPGNHDQVDFEGTIHALTPLQFAFPNPNKVKIISEPTYFLGALWLPYRRNTSDSELLLYNPSVQQCSAIFCHFDIQGALMNDDMISKNGVAISAFPGNIPIYSGHYHKPHLIDGTTIQYVGSPYQISLGEAGQKKQLYVVNNRSWDIKEAMEIDIGQRFFRVRSDSLPPPEEALKQGDRLVWTVENSSESEVQEKLELFQSLNVEVDLREVPRKRVSTRNSTIAQEGLSPLSVYERFIAHECECGQNISKDLVDRGLNVLEMLTDKVSSPLVKSVNLQVDSLSLQRYGPFKEKIIYPLQDRGLILLRGENHDNNLSADSNGSGKTSLAMAIMWVLTGSTDFRPVSDGKVTDVVYDSGRKQNFVADVTLNGTLNGLPFSIRRRKGRKITQLFLKHGDKDLTQQTASETQAVLESSEGLGLRAPMVARALFHPQHSQQGLLQATDAKLKEELSCILPMEIWQKATLLSRKLAKEYAQNVTRFEAQLSLRQRDLDIRASEWHMEKQQLGESIQQCHRMVSELESKIQDNNVTLNSYNLTFLDQKQIDIKESIKQAEYDISTLRKSIEQLSDQRSKTVEDLTKKVERLKTESEFLSRIFRNELQVHSTFEQKTKQLRQQIKEEKCKLQPDLKSVRLLKKEVRKARKVSDGAKNEILTTQASLRSLEKTYQDFIGGHVDGGYECVKCGQQVSDEVAAIRKKDLESRLVVLRDRLQQAQRNHTETCNWATQLEEYLSIASSISQLSKLAKDNRKQFKECKVSLLEREKEVSGVQQLLVQSEQSLKACKEERQAHISSSTKSLQQKEEEVQVLQRELASIQKDIFYQKEEHSRLLAGQQSLLHKLQSTKREKEVMLKTQQRKTNEIAFLQQNIQDILDSVNEEVLHKEAYEELADQFGSKGIQNFIYVGIINQLQSNADSFLEALSDGDLQLSLTLEGERIVKEAMIRTSTGIFHRRSLSQLSGGQWQRASLAMEFAFLELCSQRGLFKSNLLVLDEILTHLDAAGRHRVGRILRYLVHGGKLELSDGSVIKCSEKGTYNSVLLILQDLAAEELEEEFDGVDTVIKKADTSYVVLNDDECKIS